jgi:hypothetical protein
MAGMQERLSLQEAMVEGGIPVFTGIDSAALAMARIARWHARRQAVKAEV